MRQVEWIKVRVDMFEDEKIKLIQALPDGDAIINMWIRLLSIAGKTNDNGYIYLKEGTPYTPQMLSIIWSKTQTVIELGLKTFVDFGMIEIDTKGIYICNWDKHQNIDGLDKIRQQTNERVRKHREKKKQQELPVPDDGKEDCNVTCNVTITQGNATEEERELEKEIDKEKEIEKKKSRRKSSDDVLSSSVQDIWNHYLKTFEGLFTRLTLTANRKKVIEQRLKDPHPEKKGELLFSVEDIKLAISNIRQSAFHCGENDKKKFYAHIDFICRNADMVEKWINETPKPQQQKVIPLKAGANYDNKHSGHFNQAPAAKPITKGRTGWINRPKKYQV
jgi:predicted phage replisome organizer